MQRLHFDGGELSLSVRRFSVTEAVSRPFAVRVFARSVSDDLDLEAFVGKSAGFSLDGEGQAAFDPLDLSATPPRVWTGVCMAMEQVEVEPSGLSTYRIDLAPRLVLLRERVQNRVFRELSLPDIVKQVLGEHDLEHEWRLSGEHGAHEHRVQFGETDFDFVSRLLEEEGISYLFEQRTSGLTSKTVLVLTDAPETAEPRAPLPWAESPNGGGVGQLFATGVRLRRAARAGRVTVRDFDFVRPDFVLEGRARTAAEGPEPELEQYAYLPTAYVKDLHGSPRVVSQPEADRRATIALGARRALAREVSFETNDVDLCAGHVARIDGYPRDDVSAERWLVLEVSIEGRHDSPPTIAAAGVLASQPYRPAQNTPKPIMRGVESAIVVGPPGEEIHCDEHGRVRVQFHWDREHGYDTDSSCWVRVSQGWAGSAFGMIALPRVGQEVIVDFFDGDPDAPVVVGRLYNSRTKAPYKLPEHRTKSTFKSNSTPKSDGFNELLFEDKAGSELVYLQGERDWKKLVRATETEQTGGQRAMIVGGDRSAIVGSNDSVVVGTTFTQAMAALGELHVRGLGQPDATPKPTFVEMRDELVIHTTGKATQLLAGADISLLADRDVVIQSGGDVVIDGAHVYINSKSVGGRAPSSQAKAADDAGKPQGRVLDAIKKVFGLAKPPGDAPAGKAELDVPHRVQKGGTCGIAALGMVMDFWKAKDASLLAPPDPEMLKLAQEKGWTDTGGLWEWDNAKLAKEYGYDASYVASGTLESLKEQLDQGVPVLTTFSVDNVGDPKVGTDRGHYAVITGYFTKDGKDYLVASHGWPSAGGKVWEASAFDASWNSLAGRRMVVVKPKKS